MSQSITEVWVITLGHLETYTQVLERDKSFAALEGIKPLWRIMKSIQLKYLPILDQAYDEPLQRHLTRLGIRDITPSALTEREAMDLMVRFGTMCAVDELDELEEPETPEEA